MTNKITDTELTAAARVLWSMTYADHVSEWNDEAKEHFCWMASEAFEAAGISAPKPKEVKDAEKK